MDVITIISTALVVKTPNLPKAVIRFHASWMSQFPTTKHIQRDSAFSLGDFKKMMIEMDIEFIKKPTRRFQKIQLEQNMA